MYGPWRGAQSKLYLALLSVGFTPKALGQGGSYGYGKAGLIAGSKIRTVVAYTCFDERLDDRGVTRRLLGMTYWGQHSVGADDYTGFARFGRPDGASARPFENEEADEAARLLGLDRRDPANPNHWGTTLLLVEPAVGRRHLEEAICRSWWPALDQDNHDAGFHVVIEGADGERCPRPKSDPALASFHDAYEIANQVQAAPETRRKRYELQPTLVRPGKGKSLDGVLGLVADPDGWTFARSGSGDRKVNHRSLVALMRKPRMVVEYLDVGQAPPFVRGVFVADDSVNDLLRRTEPKGHDAWRTRPDDEDGSSQPFEVAASIAKRIKARVNAFRRELKPPPKPAETYQLKLFQREMRKLLGGSGPGGPPPPPKRFMTIRFTDGPRQRPTARPDRYVVTGKAEIALSEHAKEDETLAEVEIRYPLLEDGRVRAAVVNVEVEPPTGFTTGGVDGGPANGRFRGVLHRGEPIAFRFETAPIPSDWTGRLEVRADPLDGARRPQPNSPDPAPIVGGPTEDAGA